MGNRRQQEMRRGKRQENRHERRRKQHAGGSDWDCIKIPEGVKVFKPKAKTTYHIDVIPYIVGDKNKNANKGDEYFELSYAVYKNLGIDSKKFIAIGEMLGVADPIVEHFASLRRQGVDWDEMKGFKPTWRQLMLIFVHEEEENGLQLYEGAWGALGELLEEELIGEETDYVDNFDDPDHGATLEIRFKGENIGMKKPWIKASKINLIEREDGFTADGNKKLAAAILEQASNICLDDCLKIPTYDELKAALEGRPTGIEKEDETEEEEKPKQAKQTRRKGSDKKKEEKQETAKEDDGDWEFPDKPQDKPKKETKEKEDDLPFDTEEQEKPEEKEEKTESSDEDWDDDW